MVVRKKYLWIGKNIMKKKYKNTHEFERRLQKKLYDGTNSLEKKGHTRIRRDMTKKIVDTKNKNNKKTCGATL